MDKRLLKRHKRQVARAKEQVRLSVPDLRTPEELRIAREASQPVNRRSLASFGPPPGMAGRGLARSLPNSPPKGDA